MHKVEKIMNNGPPETIEALERGEISINRAYKETKSQERNNDTPPTTYSPPIVELPNAYSVIYADYPWELEASENSAQAKENFLLPVKSTELKKLQIPTEDNAILLMWSTVPTLEKALQVMNAWGFKYKSNMIWDRQFASTGQWTRSQHEILLIGIKGNFAPPSEDLLVSSVYSEEQKESFLKPSYFYEQIERMFPGEKYLELFSQKKHSNHWEDWGNQILQPKSEGE